VKPGRSRSADGSAYGLPEPSYDAELVEVGAGTPAGELLRRYWHPVGVSSELADLPVPVRVLGEDLILFRTGQGRPGLVYPRCIHRGTTLRYGKVESNGIRCCYHGWLFDPEGRCLEQPCEPGGGRKLELYRQPWYPLEERYGLVFAYLGPPERRRSSRVTTCWRTWTSTCRCTRRPARCRRAGPRSCPATGCRPTRTWPTPVTPTCSTA